MVRASRLFVGFSPFLALCFASSGCVEAHDLLIDNRTVTSLTMRIYSPEAGDESGGKFSQFPDRIFSLPPNREFRVERALVATGREDRRLFEFRGSDEQLVDAFVVTYSELERNGGRITVPRSLAAIPRDAPPASGYVDSSQYEHIEYIPILPKDSAPGVSGR